MNDAVDPASMPDEVDENNEALAALFASRFCWAGSKRHF